MADDFDDVANAVDAEANDFMERVSPHELTGAKRHQWMADLWRAFEDLQVKGVITLADAVNIADTLHVDGEDHFIEEHVTNTKEVTFKQLVATLDDMSRSSGNEYRDVELDRAAAEDGALVEHLGPLDYIRYLCGGHDAIQRSRDEAANAAASAENGGVPTTGGKPIETVTNRNVEYRLSLAGGRGDLTPKQKLIVTTVALLLIIAGCIIAGMLGMWDFTVVAAVERNLRVIHAGVATLVSSIEETLLVLHAKGIIAQTELLARWNEELSDDARRNTLLANRIGAERVAGIVAAAAASAGSLQNARIQASADLLRELAWLGATVDASSAAIVMERAASSAAAAAPCNITVLTSSGTTLCYTQSGANATGIAIAALDEANSELDNGRQLTAFAGATSVGTSHDGRCVIAFGSPGDPDYCAELFAKTRSAVQTSAMHGLETTGIANTTYIVGGASCGAGCTIGFQTDLQWQLERFRWRLVDIVNFLNFEFVRSTEIVIALRDQVTGVITAQATAFRFDDGCYFACERFPPSTVNIRAAFQKKDSGWALTPDYRPEPVIGGYSYVGRGLDLAIVFERDVIEVRGISAGVIRGVLRGVNDALGGIMHLWLIGFRDIPLMQTFPAFAECPDTTDCVVDPKGPLDTSGFGTYFRYDCGHCQRIPDSDLRGSALVDYVCPNAGGCPVDSPTAQEALTTKRQSTTLGKDSHGFVATSFVLNYSVAVELTTDFGHSTGRFRATIQWVAAVTIGMLLVGLAALIGSSMSSFSALEEEWSRYKDQLEEEKTKFGTLVKGLIPPSVAERLMGGSRVIADHVSTASFTFVDVAGFSEVTKSWTARHVARHMTYCVSLMESVAAHCDVLKLRSIGDLVITVGLRDERHRTEPEYHPARRALQFSAITLLLFSKLYVHRPQTTRVFRELFKDKMREGNSIEMPSLRIGVHCGPTISGAFAIGKASHYDFYGPGPALANRMQQTALPNRIHVTVMVKEMLRNRDPHNKYLFDHSRKTVVRGHGTITSFFVRTVTEHVPYELMRANGADYARMRFDFLRGQRQRQTVINDSESVVSSDSGNHSRDPGKSPRKGRDQQSQ